MKKLLLIVFAVLPLMAMAQQPDAKTILKKVDQNMYSKSKIITASITIQGARVTRTIEEKVWIDRTAFSRTRKRQKNVEVSQSIVSLYTFYRPNYRNFR